MPPVSLSAFGGSGGAATMIVLNLVVNLVVMLMLSVVVLVLAVAFVASTGLAATGRSDRRAGSGHFTRGALGPGEEPS